MKTLAIEKLPQQDHLLTYAEWAKALAGLNWQDIAVAPWQQEYPYVPTVKFQIAYTQDDILLHFEVQEEYVKGQYIRPNENVWEDSCVEFFVSFDNRETYYNIEFNVLGVGLIGYGRSVKADRNRLPAADILRIQTFSAVQTIQGKKQWQQVLQIPIALFEKQASELEGTTAYANFYKCGDGLPQPHFIAWNAIDSPTPNFHQPAFFGQIEFK